MQEDQKPKHVLFLLCYDSLVVTIFFMLSEHKMFVEIKEIRRLRTEVIVVIF